jgi:hypothetical protein
MAIKDWPEEVYKKESVNDLILISFFYLENSGQKIIFEELLGKCFDFFPKKFNFLKHLGWPDSRKLDRPLRILRERGMIKNERNVFSLTKKGRKRAMEIMNVFRQKKLNL